MNAAAFALADANDGQYADDKQLIGAILGKLKIEARKAGWKGFFLVHATVEERRGKSPQYAVQIGPGHGDVTVEQVGDFLREQLKARK